MNGLTAEVKKFIIIIIIIIIIFYYFDFSFFVQETYHDLNSVVKISAT